MIAPGLDVLLRELPLLPAEREVPPTRTVHRSRRTIQGFGLHDAIVETTDSQAMALMSDVHVTDVLRIYKARYDELSLDPRIAHVTTFKNHGIDAGTSLEHPRSQLIAAPVIAYQVRQRFSEALRHHDDFGVCMFCQMIEEELELNERMVLVTEHFVGLQPFASPTPFCTHIYPRRHMASFGDISAKEPTSAAWCAPSWPSCTTASKTPTST